MYFHFSCLALPLTNAHTVHMALADFYQAVRNQVSSRQLLDLRGQPPHISLRTLCRTLSVAATNPCHHPLRSLYEALCMRYPTIHMLLASS